MGYTIRYTPEGKIIREDTGKIFRNAILVLDTHEAIDTGSGKRFRFEDFSDLKEKASKEDIGVFVLINRQEGNRYLRLY